MANIQQIRSIADFGRAICIRVQIFQATVLKALIINADDFGLTASVNDAIIDAFKYGSVTSTTLMVNTSATTDAANKASCHPELGVGLHFNITLGQPLSDTVKVQSLVDASGTFLSRSVLARQLLLRRVSRIELELELSAQYERMQAYDLHPTHIDSHQHIHAFPLCFDAVARLCKSKGLPLRMPWILHPKNVHVPPGRRARQWLLKRMLKRNHEHWNGLVKWNSGLGSLFDLGSVPQSLNSSHYRALLESAPQGVFELMVHPAKDARQLEGLTGIGQISEQEWRFLMSGNLQPLLTELNFTLANYRSL